MNIQKCCKCYKPFSYKTVLKSTWRGKVLECDYCKTKHKESKWNLLPFTVLIYIVAKCINLYTGVSIGVTLIAFILSSLIYPCFVRLKIYEK